MRTNAPAAAGSENVELLGSTGRPLPCVEVRFLTHPGLPDGEILLHVYAYAGVYACLSGFNAAREAFTEYDQEHRQRVRKHSAKR